MTDTPDTRAMMYWSSLFQNENTDELDKKINEEMMQNQVEEMLEQEPDNPLDQVMGDDVDDKGVEQTTSAKKSNKELDDALKTTKLLKDVFAPSKKSKVNANDFANWKNSKERLVQHLEGMSNDMEEIESDPAPYGGTESSIGYEMAAHEVESVMNELETKMIDKMDLQTLLSDEELANTITPQMSMIETLLMQKNNLSGASLRNAKRLIRRYVRKLAEKFKPQVEQSVIKVRDPDIVPKRTFRNLDIKRTLWENLPNWDPEEGKLYVDKLRFHRASEKRLPSKLIVVVDQSGSMIPAMVQSTILASIFAGLPNVEIELFAFDTRILNLSKYVHDPFEVLLQTKLGGGTHINNACLEARKGITVPNRTGFILITDYYEGGSYDLLFTTIKDIQDKGVSFISVGPMGNRSRVVRVNAQFTKRLESIGIDTIMGGIDDLIDQIAEVIK